MLGPVDAAGDRGGVTVAALAVVLFVAALVGAAAVDAAVAADRQDTSGDRIPDAWKAAGESPSGEPLPGADPDRKQVYLVVVYGEGVAPLTEREKASLRAIWASMPVENPDGSTGIELVVIDEPPYGGQLDERVRVGSAAESDRVGERYYRERIGDGACAYHLAVLGNVTADRGGWANAPGYTLTVDGHATARGASAYTWRVRLLTHELLHTVVGRVDDGDDPYHTDTGWLSYRSDPAASQHLSNATARRLNESGFAERPYYARSSCA